VRPTKFTLEHLREDLKRIRRDNIKMAVRIWTEFVQLRVRSSGDPCARCYERLAERL
jgi:hypothetical protein